jgi:starch-binding outer membrane protein SusE/F
MKNIIKFLIALISIATVSCTDSVQDREAVATSAAPVLVAPAASGLTFVLDKTKPNDLATTVVWNYAAYSGTATVVNYSVEFAVAGTKFASPVVVATSTDRFKNFTVNELNTAALDAGFPPFVASSIDVRVTSTVGTTGSIEQVSNFYTIKITPYPAWPDWGIIGSATPTGWDSDTNMNYDLATKTYNITMSMIPGAYKFRLDDGWGTNYGSSSGTGGALVLNGSDIPIAVAGNYKITADFNAKTYTVTKL